MGWLYNDTLYKTTKDFTEAWEQGLLPKFSASIDGDWAHSGHRGDVLPLDNLPPPLAVAPSGSRYSYDEDAMYFEWMGFSFYLAFSSETGMSFHDIRHKRERIIYELAFQEALAHYAGTDPVQSTTSFLDSSYGMGDLAIELIPGYDCLAYVCILWHEHYSIYCIEQY